ncbi:hypothetical protein G7B40_007315 [Aetokthonos hydrillicola Thurmond2011]|uniref:Uncharacterized protein n=1 Tax=Aetokthonos hydrillicola Thurmond2011 TaxID=2712845 RepID=A0AAP5M6S3_9CYAN|nr:hypothetical protein [Aetokthonos hydrillicola]MBO3459306.1 hypothetical protein [Aetokthonos hydrillicola CCALA 1050]MBW4587732.1 hypothetical protein [Aetokthonos hydrillicola CCALA 1050]MDR9894380.1 hypothetical protein [Aetokthonos hydrillicola Thurmond2011]
MPFETVQESDRLEVLRKSAIAYELRGAHLIADTRKLLQNPRIQAILSHGK